MIDSIQDLYPMAAEIFLLCAICVIIVVDVFSFDRERTWSYRLTQVSLLTTAIIAMAQFGEIQWVGYGGHYVMDKLGIVLKVAVIAIAMLALVYARPYVADRKMLRGEYLMLTLFAVLGAMVMVSGYSFLVLYLGLELLSLSLYAMVAMRRDNRLAAEAAVKYFVMGALASGFLLYGMSLVYGAAGSLMLSDILPAVTSAVANPGADPIFAFGITFMVAGLAFKLGAAPFQMWVPDVYHGAPTSVTAFISSVPKVAAFGLMIRLLVEGFGPLHAEWQQLLIIMAVLSIGIGNMVAIAQTSLKRMLAYSGIAHVGFFLLGVIAGTQTGYAASLFYIISYAIMSLGGFGMIIFMSRQGFDADAIDDFKGLGQRNPWQAFMMTIVLLSMGGIPPLLGFWAKLEVIMAVARVDMVWLAIYAVFFSIVGLYYYLRVIKTMFFDKPEEGAERVNAVRGLRFATALNGLAIIFLGLFPGLILDYCLQALAAI